MLTGFTNIPDLNESEMMQLDNIISIISRYGKQSPIKSPELVKVINETLNIKINDVKLRKFISYIRCNSLLPVIATSKGYFVSHEPQDIMNLNNSLEQRALKLFADIKGMKYFLQNKQLQISL